MKQTTSLSEDKVRGLIRNAEQPLEYIKQTLAEIARTTAFKEMHTATFINVVNALTYIRELKEELGFKEPEGTTLKQIEIPY